MLLLDTMNLSRSQDLLVWFLSVVVAWKVSWFVIHLFTGFHVRYVSINNGISLNGVTLRTSKLDVSVKSVRYRLWGNTRKLIVDEMSVTLRESSKESSKVPRKTSTKPSFECETFNLYPSSSIGLYLTRFLLKHVPRVDLELRSSSLLVRDQLLAIDYLTFSIDSKHTHTGFLQFVFKVIVNNVEQSKGPTTSCTLSSLQLTSDVSIKLATGEVDTIKVRAFANESKVSVFNLLKYYMNDVNEKVEEVIPSAPTTKSTSATTSTHTAPGSVPGQSRASTASNKRIFLSKLHNCMAEVSLHLEDSQICEIPFSSLLNNQDFKDYFAEPKPKNSIELLVKSCSITWSRVYDNSAGYEYLFNAKNDRPVQVACSVQLLKLNYTTYGNRTDEILMVPSYSANFKSNIGNHIIQGYGFKNSLVELFVSASSPTLDLTTLQLSEVFYNFILLQKYLKLKNLKKPAQHTKTSRSSVLRDKLVHLLGEYYPHSDLKLIIEQPRLIIRHHVSGKVQLVNFSYSLLNFHLLTTNSRDYHSNCNILNPSIVYFEKLQAEDVMKDTESTKVDVVAVTDINLTLNVLKNLKVKAHLKVNECTIDSSKLSALLGFNLLIKDFVEMVEKDLSKGNINLFLNSEIINHKRNTGYIARSRVQKPDSTQILFNYLPSWLVQARIEFNSISVLLGSRSVLIPKHLISKLEGEGLAYDYVGSQKELRYAKLTLDNWSILLKDGEDIQTETPPTSSASSTSSRTITQDSSYWQVLSKLSNLTLSTHLNLEKSAQLSPFLKVPEIEFSFQATTETANNENLLKAAIQINKVNLTYDNYKLFTLLGTFYLLQEFLIAPLKSIQSKLMKDFKKYSGPILSNGTQKRSLEDILALDLKIKEVEIFAILNNTFKLRIQSTKSAMNVSNGIVTFHNEFLRGLTESPCVSNQWSRLFCIDTLQVVANDPSRDNLIGIITDSIRLMQPHSFVVHRLFDYIATTAKAAKYLFRFLKYGAQEGVIQPTEMKALKLPFINLKSTKLTFEMDDDPFESDLNMIYQLGIVEQRKRLEQLNLFQGKCDLDKVDEMYAKIKNLHESFSKSWVRKVRQYKARLNKEICNNKKNLFGIEATFPSEFNQNVVAYPSFAPLLSIIMSNLNLDVSSPDFDLDELPNFLHRIGQGIPKDTKYSTMVPMHLDMSLTELRMHLRDYPLPLLHVPKNKVPNKASLRMKGHLIIGEELVLAKENVKNIEVPLALISNNKELDKYHSMTIAKTLSTVKLYTDLACHFDTEHPSRFVWGHSYSFGIQQTMLNFDQFSKAPIDPSLKLGFWDKMKLVMHGKFQIKTDSRLEVAIKGSSDPYDLLDTASGFILSFDSNVVCDINEHDDSKQFIKIHSDNVSWYIPNYLGAPLIPWTRDSSKAVYLPNSKEFITSAFAFHLFKEDATTLDSKTQILEKTVVNLSGGVDFVVGFLLQRKTDHGRTSDLSPHYKVKLYNPDFTEEGHDSFAGFRSDYIHMAITLHANKDTSYNSIHLTPKVFEQFFKWWKLFSGNTSLPVRRGILFGELKKSQKFSQSLYTNKFDFNFKSVFISHIYREIEDGDAIDCVGVRAKVDNFSMDLHQRKEAAIEIQEGLSREKKIMKMHFNVGEIHLSGIDMRVIHASFKQNLYDPGEHDKKNDKNFGNDMRWFDVKDYEEAFFPSLSKCSRSIVIHPLLYSKRFSYIRNTKSDKEQSFGSENTHDCTLNSRKVFEPQIDSLVERVKELKEQMSKNITKKKSTSNLATRIDFLNEEIDDLERKRDLAAQDSGTDSSSDSSSDVDSSEPARESFNNKFVLVNMFLKWNADNRNNLLKYIHFVQLKQSLMDYLSYESINAVEDIIRNSEDMRTIQSSLQRVGSINKTGLLHSSSAERLANFDKILRQIKSSEGISEDYLIEIISPQIQLQSEDKPDSIVLIATPKIDGKIISVLDKSTEAAVPRALESRYGIRMKQANIFVFHKEELDTSDDLVYSKENYGSQSNWPPWLGIEICKNAIWAGEDKLLVEKTSLMLIYEKGKPLKNRVTSDDDDDDDSVDDGLSIDRLSIDFPKLVISSTSKQYFTMYIIILSLLFYSEPMSKSLGQKLEKLKFSIDFQDLYSLRDRLISLHKYLEMLNMLLLNYGFRQNALTNEQLNEQIQLNLEKNEVVAEIYLLMQTILSGDTYSRERKPKAHWSIRADEIILHMLEDDRTPILDFAMASAQYRRLVNEDGSNGNKLQIGMMQGFNLIKTANYPEFLEPYNLEDSGDQSMLTFDWTLNRSVGGIRIIENIEIASVPLNIKIDEITGTKLMTFIFGSESDIEESPLLSFTHNIKEEELKEDLEEDDDEKQSKDEKSTDSTYSLKKSEGSKTFSQSMSSTELDKEGRSDQVKEMIKRSKTFFSIVKLRLQPTSLSISIDLKKGYKRLLNVQNFLINLPEFIIEKKMMSLLDITKQLQRMVLKTLASHSGRLIKNKFMVKKSKSKRFINRPMRPLKKYARFTRVSELVMDTYDSNK